MNLYPAQMRRIADICEALNKADGADSPETDGVTLGLQQKIRLTDEHGSFFGTFSDEIGGAWSFQAAVVGAD